MTGGAGPAGAWAGAPPQFDYPIRPGLANGGMCARQSPMKGGNTGFGLSRKSLATLTATLRAS